MLRRVEIGVLGRIYWRVMISWLWQHFISIFVVILVRYLALN